MAKIGYVQNGVKRRHKKRNPSAGTGATVKARNPARATTLAGAKSFAKKNGLKLVSKSVANPKRKRHHKRRNGLQTASGYTSRARNGILGNTKQDAQQVGTVLGGAALTKIISRFLTPWVAPQLAKVGAGNFSELITDGAVALVVVPFLAGKTGMRDASKMARLGGLLVVGLDAIEMIAPNFLQYNPFNTSPIVMSGGQATLAPKAVAAIVNETSATPQEKAQVSGAMAQLEQSGYMGNESGGMNARGIMPLMTE